VTDFFSSNLYKNPQCRHCRHTDGALQNASKTDNQNGHILLISWLKLWCFVRVTNYHLYRTCKLPTCENFKLGSEYFTKPKACNVWRNTFHWVRYWKQTLHCIQQYVCSQFQRNIQSLSGKRRSILYRV